MLFETQPLSSPHQSVHSPPQSRALTLRQPCIDDAVAIHELITRCPPLDINSLYAYLLLTHHHAATCIVATDSNNQVYGFVSAYIPPQASDVLFVWQVAVDEAVRGTGLGKHMLSDLLSRPVLQEIRFLETTVSPDNQASQHLFASLARRYATSLTESTLFGVQHFGTQSHEPEHLLRLGPF